MDKVNWQTPTSSFGVNFNTADIRDGEGDKEEEIKLDANTMRSAGCMHALLILYNFDDGPIEGINLKLFEDSNQLEEESPNSQSSSFLYAHLMITPDSYMLTELNFVIEQDFY